MIKKGCATFLVGEEVKDGAPRRFAMPVELLVHPRIMELLAEAEEKYGYAHEGAIVLPCCVERFQKAIDEATAQERHRRHQGRPWARAAGATASGPAKLGAPAPGHIYAKGFSPQF
uniref:Uncharacterized protein n=1 Tax=Aegilops tauschii TaxID=37682 RepID=M8B9F2_AEGTA